MTVYKRLLQAVKWFFMGIVATVLMLLLVFTIGGYLFSAPYYDGPASNHFDGERFFNPNGALANKSFRELIRWQFNRKVGPWRDWVDSRPGSPPPGRVTKGNMRVTFINHATLLVQLDGVNVLTDPIWSERASPLPWIGPRRVRNPGIRFEDLPPIEAVVLSHNHYDHTDLPTLQRLQRSHDPVFYCHLGNKALLRQRFGRIRMSLLPIGAFRPEWFMKEAHISPDEAVEAHRRLSSSTSMAIHYGTFHLGDDGETEPVERLHKAMKSAGVSPARFWVMEFGEGRDIPPIRR
jgi:L-ascorbate metabolism protein UlaG (beta-lactamase superfamily)